MNRDVVSLWTRGRWRSSWFNELGVKTCWDMTEELKFHSPPNNLNLILYISNNLLAVISWCFCSITSQLKAFSHRCPNLEQKHENIRCYERTWALGWSGSSSQLRLGSITAVHTWSCEVTRPESCCESLDSADASEFNRHIQTSWKLPRDTSVSMVIPELQLVKLQKSEPSLLLLLPSHEAYFDLYVQGRDSVTRLSEAVYSTCRTGARRGV